MNYGQGVVGAADVQQNYPNSNTSSSSYIQAAYSPQQFHHNTASNMSSSPNFVITSPQPQYFNLHQHHHLSSHHNGSNGSANGSKTNSIRYGSNSELNKRTRNSQSHGYELSQDLIDKQLELLERKYGGKFRANRAALVIQRAYRRYMLNKKFASIRATAHVKQNEKRTSSIASGNNASNNQRMSQSQSMEMYGMNYQANNSNEIFMRDHRTIATMSSSSGIASSPTTPLRNNSLLMKNGQPNSTSHPYVNLMHQQYQQQQQMSPHLQYQNNNNSSTSNLSFGSPMIVDNSNQSWTSNPSPLVQHYTAAQIYMRPKNYIQPNATQSQPHSPQHLSNSNTSSPMVSHRKPPPEVPKRMTSSVSTTSLKKSNGLSRSGTF
jgi:IQ motif/SEC7 domain-containing protein